MAPSVTHRLLAGLVMVAMSASAGAFAQFEADTDPGRFLVDNRLALSQGETLAAWKAAHPRDAIELYDGLLSHIENWCVRATLDTPIGSGRSARRTAYFFPPDDARDRLPSGSPDELRDRCRLGLIWTEVQTADGADATRTVDTLRRSIASAVGVGVEDVTPMWYDSGSWRNTTFWYLSPVTVVASTRNDRPQSASFAFAAAAGPASHADFQTLPLYDSDIGADLLARWHETAARLREAIGRAGVPGRAGAGVRVALELLDSYRPPMRFPPAADRLTALNAIDSWLSASARLPAPRRAAALFVADQLLTALGSPGWAERDAPPIRQRLEAQGAEFIWNDPGGTFVYTHTWLNEVRRIDPEGRAGELAYLTLMEMGFETSACADQGGTGFRTVVREGDAYLRAHPRSPIAPEVHLLMASAYADIVALASGLGYDGAEEAKQYAPESARARENAIEQFRLAFDARPQPPRAPNMWPAAWRLLAGVAPTRTFFYCIND